MHDFPLSPRDTIWKHCHQLSHCRNTLTTSILTIVLKCSLLSETGTCTQIVAKSLTSVINFGLPKSCHLLEKCLANGEMQNLSMHQTLGILKPWCLNKC